MPANLLNSMKLIVDTPVRVTRRELSGKVSYILDTLGGSLWFSASSVPSDLASGMYKYAEIECVQGTVNVRDRARVVYYPRRLLVVK